MTGPANVRELENASSAPSSSPRRSVFDADLLPESIRSKEIVRGVRLQLSEFLPPLPVNPVPRLGGQSATIVVPDHGRNERRIIVNMLERTAGPD